MEPVLRYVPTCQGTLAYCSKRLSIMRKSLLGALSLAAFTVSTFTVSASAADLRAPMPVKAPLLAPAPAFSWQGFYVGGTLGGRSADIDWTTTGIGVPGLAPPAVPVPGTANATYDSTTFRAGIYGGYNFLIAPKWLIGVEADVAWGDGSTSRGFIPGVTAAGITTDATSVTHTWDAGLRARLGYLLTPDWMLFATGGFAWQHVEASLTCGATTCPLVVLGATTAGGSYTATDSETLSGWSIGLGIEGRLWGNWIGRAEYRYANLGTWNAVFASPRVNGFVTTADIDVQTHTFALGLGYKF